MREFTDTTGRKWAVEVNATTLKRVRGLLDINLLTVLEDECKLLADLHSDPILLVDVLYVLCRDQAEKAGVSDEDFGRAMSGDVIEAGLAALLEELTSFFPKPQHRQVMGQALAKLRRIQEVVLTDAAGRLEAIDVDSTAKSVIDSFTSSPASSGSTQDL